jgi:hypothetical protein
MEPLYPTHSELRPRLAIVVPAWYSPATDPGDAQRLLLTTLADCATLVEPERVVVVVDGSPVAGRAARAVQAHLRPRWGASFTLIELEENQGKGAAIVAGLKHLLGDRNPPEWTAVRDADGDHLLDDLPHLARAGVQIADENPGRPVAVVGRRTSLHAPMGWVRGEFELLVNEVLIDGLAYALARAGSVWDARYLIDRVLDLQSGYKLYSRDAASIAVEALTREADRRPELKLARTGMEIVPSVEIALAGGVWGEVARKTFFDQPVTSYGSVNFAEFYGSKLAWALERCAVPAEAAAPLIDGALLRRPLYCDPSGRAALLDWRRYVLSALAGDDGPATLVAEPRGRRLL